MGYIIYDQMPAHGCDNCGKGDGLPQWQLRRMLKRSGSYWLCYECRKLEKQEIEQQNSRTTE